MEIAGLIGLIILVVVFLFQSAGFFKEKGKKEMLFYLCNGVGAGLLAQYAFSIPNIYFGILESIWCIAAFMSGLFFYRKTFLKQELPQVEKE